MIAEIDGTDISACIQESSYKIDRAPEYSDWTDANNKTHRFIIRNRVSGSFEAVFIPGLTMDYAAFLALVNAATTDGVLKITLQINNTGTYEEISCFCTIAFEAPRKISNTLTYKRATITIQEQ